VLAVISLLLAAQSAYAALLLMYAWEDRERQLQNRAPETFDPPRISFTILLPARHEEDVIKETILRLAGLNYPRELVEVLVVVESGDLGTIAEVQRQLADLAAQGTDNMRLLTFSDLPINKPHGLNVGLAEAGNEVVTIFDAEDEPHHDILQVVNTVMLRERSPVVQCGVQLMNYGDRWYSALNVLEYFFWFRSRMHYHAATNMVALGGNTVFIERHLLDEMEGWDSGCLTEDADIGIRISAAGIPIRVLYDDRYVTKEETPPSARQFIRQRTRWNQGFLQVLAKGDWLRLPSWRQRLLALYTLSAPLMQALMLLYIPVSLWMMAALKTPELIAMISTLPLYMLIVQLAVNLIGLYEFTGVHGLRPSPWSPVVLLLTYIPYQWMLCLAALRAVWRQLRGINTWEKTTHTGAHRRSTASAAVEPSRQEVAGG